MSPQKRSVMLGGHGEEGEGEGGREEEERDGKGEDESGDDELVQTDERNDLDPGVCWRSVQKCSRRQEWLHHKL